MTGYNYPWTRATAEDKQEEAVKKSVCVYMHTVYVCVGGRGVALTQHIYLALRGVWLFYYLIQFRR